MDNNSPAPCVNTDVFVDFSLKQYTKHGHESVHINTIVVLTDKGIEDSLAWMKHVLYQAKGNNEKFGSA